MAPWLAEKAQSVLLSLINLYESCKASNLAQEEMDEIRSKKLGIFPAVHEISIAVHDCTKILAFATGSVWDTTDPDMIIENGRVGYDVVLLKYGLMY